MSKSKEPNKEFLTHEDFKNMLLLSCQKIIDHRSAINSINVFPVPDKDTGSNMAKTVEGLKTALEKNDCSSFSQLTAIILDTALISAQGNSGMILTGFFQGFCNHIKNKEQLSAKDLSTAFKLASDKSRDSIENPVSGTILDVIEQTAKTFSSTAETEDDIATILYKTVTEAQTALKETTNKMALLKQSHVVDAGGYGFLLLLEGFYEYLSQKPFDHEMTIDGPLTASSPITIGKNKYEVIFILKDCVLEKHKLMELLSSMGDSIDIIDSPEKLKTHIHTDNPHAIKEVALSLGDVLHLEIIDMELEKVIETIQN